jgi:hypothetical protein
VYVRLHQVMWECQEHLKEDMTGKDALHFAYDPLAGATRSCIGGSQQVAGAG